jgi:hypothetical protein
MMTNPNPEYRRRYWWLDEFIDEEMYKASLRAYAQVAEDIARKWELMGNLFKGPITFPHNMGNTKIVLEDKDAFLPPLTDKIEKPVIKNPLLCIEYDGPAGKLARMKTDPKIWVPDSLSRDPVKLAGAIAQAVIHNLMGRKGFADWWVDLDELRCDEIRAGLACDIAVSLPRHPEEATVNYAKERSIDPEAIPNPDWVSVDAVWVPSDMIPADLPTLGAVTWLNTSNGGWEHNIEVCKKEVVKWLRRTSLNMAQDKHVSKADKNRFKDLAALVNWEY